MAQAGGIVLLTAALTAHLGDPQIIRAALADPLRSHWAFNVAFWRFMPAIAVCFVSSLLLSAHRPRELREASKAE